MSRRLINPVVVYDICEDPRRPSPFLVRWTCYKRQHSRSFKLKTPARSFYADLVKAVSNHEKFNEISGLPKSWELDDTTAPKVALQWFTLKIPAWEKRTRMSHAEGIAQLLIELVKASAKTPSANTLPDIRRWLMTGENCPDWLSKNTLSVAALNRAVCVNADSRIALKFEPGTLTRSTKLSSPKTANRYRGTARQLFKHLVTIGLLDTNIYPAAIRGRRASKERTTKALRVDLLPTAQEALACIAAVKSHQPSSAAYMGVLYGVYMLGLRPSEAIALRIESCQLPATGFGSVIIDSAVKSTPKHYEIDATERVGAPKTDTRVVPIPPAYVALIKQNIGDRTTGIIWPNRKGSYILLTNLNRAWRKARSKKSWRIYDLRHAHATHAIQAGAQFSPLAARLGHSVKMLLDVYLGALPGDDARLNEVIASFIPDKI